VVFKKTLLFDYNKWRESLEYSCAVSKLAMAMVGIEERRLANIKRNKAMTASLKLGLQPTTEPEGADCIFRQELSTEGDSFRRDEEKEVGPSLQGRSLHC
jgi:hypothetical protein